MCVLVYSCFGKNPLTRYWLTTHLSLLGCYTPSVTSLKKNTEGDKGKVDVRESMLIQSPLPTKRSKRRENSVDEDSNAHAERLKAERNIDSPGKATPKSFLALTDAQIATRITTLGVSLGSNLDKY
jgi:hypothetical protein